MQIHFKVSKIISGGKKSKALSPKDGWKDAPFLLLRPSHAHRKAFSFFLFFSLLLFFLTLQREDLRLQLIFNANIAIWYHSN